MDYKIDKFYGLNTAVKDRKTLRPGTSPDSLNWLTTKEKDAIELRRGSRLLGKTEVLGVGRVSGIGVGTAYDGTQQIWFSYDRKIKFFNKTTKDTQEIATADILPAAASGEDIWMQQYQNLAGTFLFAGSQNSGIYKVPVSNPSNFVDQAVNNFRFGVFHIGQNRAFASQRNGDAANNNDQTGLYLSFIDKDQLSDFTETTAESVGTGDGAEVTFTGTFANAGAPATLMYANITDSVETFKDDRAGNLVGDLGGTGTINYATGAFSVTFATAPTDTQNITAGYYVEDATNNGILDFTVGGAGQGKSFRQDNGGGAFMAIHNLNVINFCFHRQKTWQYQSSLDDTSSTNLEYRNVGIPYTRASHQTPDGIIFADVSNANEPKYRKMEVISGSDANVEPQPISDDLDLSPFGHDNCVAFRWGDYEIFAIKGKTLGIANGYNSVSYIRNVVSKQWDRVDYYISCLAEYEGMLLAGDSISNNVYVLFSGLDEDGGTIDNYWSSSRLNLDTDNLKTCRRMVIEGLIQPNQDIEVEISYDGAPFVKVFTINGSADYVDQGNEVSVGSQTIGASVVGGGGDFTASPYEVDFKLNSDRFVDIAVRFQATDIGYASVTAFTLKDIRKKGKKNLPKRTK